MASSLLPQKFMQVKFLFLSLSLLSHRLNEQQSYYFSKFTQQMASQQFYTIFIYKPKPSFK